MSRIVLISLVLLFVMVAGCTQESIDAKKQELEEQMKEGLQTKASEIEEDVKAQVHNETEELKDEAEEEIIARLNSSVDRTKRRLLGSVYGGSGGIVTPLPTQNSTNTTNATNQSSYT